jgi:hypothetical protein
MRIMPLILLLLAASGCTTYEYDLVRPEDQARHIGSKNFETVTIDPLEYRLQSYDNRLVMEIHNPTSDLIALLGDRSAVVDPNGQSHPLRSQSIAPVSYIKLIFPPIRPTVQGWGPTVGMGVGYNTGAVNRAPYVYDEPHYYTVYDESSALYWDWKGETDVRMTLVFRRGEKTFGHELVFHRRKM